MAGFFASRRAVAVAELICIALLLVSLNIVAGHFLAVRLDLTAERLYTLSPGTLRTLARLDEPIVLRLYYSTRLGDEVPSYGVYAQRVRELLDQYVAAADGKLRLEIYDPQPFSDTEDRAVAFGLQAVPLDREGEQVYFGLAGTNSTDDEQVIPFFDPERERFIEYDLTKLVHSLADPKKTVLGLITALPLEGDVMAMMQGRPSAPMAVMEQLDQLDTVKPLATELDAIPADIDVLMLAQPPELPDKTLYAIDQFVLKGGRALIFVDPHSELLAAQSRRSGAPPASSATNLAPLFKAWGFAVPADQVVADRRNAQRVNVPALGGARPLDYVAWLDLHADGLARDNMITADLSHLTMAGAGSIEPIDGATTKLEPLVTSSPDAMKIPADKLQGRPDVAGLLRDFKSDNRRYVLAARVIGPATTAFPDGPPKPPPVKSDKAPEAAPPTEAKPAAAAAETVKQAVRPINLVVVADSDMLADRFWAEAQDFFGRRVMTPFANNGDFVADAVETLAGGEDLIGLRSRGTSGRPFEVVDRIQRRAQERYSAEEQSLQDKLKSAQTKLQSLVGRDHASTANLSPEETKAIAQFRTDMLDTRRQLRGVRAALRSNIEQLKAVLEFLDIALIPILVAVAAIVLGAARVRRHRRRTAEA